MESLEMGRRFKRNFESYFTNKRIIIIVLSILIILMYIIPNVVRWFSIRRSPADPEDEMAACLRDRLTSFYSEAYEYNANIKHIPADPDEKPYVAYVGNGLFGLEVDRNSQLYFKQGRSLSLPTLIYPLVNLHNIYITSYKEATVTNYLTGIVHVFRCYRGGIYASFQYYAHRTLQSILVQEIKVSNPTDSNFEISVQSNKFVPWGNLPSTTVTVQGENGASYKVYTGSINASNDSEVVAVSIACRNFPIKLYVEARKSRQIHLLTSLNYSTPIKKNYVGIKKAEVEKSVIESLRKAAAQDQTHLKENHANAWQELWRTGLTIGTSKAKDALNGDKINATMYYVLSQVKVQNEATSKDLVAISNHVSYAEGCYGDYHTLEAKKLWGSLETIEDVNQKTSFWLLTLEKHGCHNLMMAGALGVVQAMVLSFGGLQFSNQRLEFNIHPKYLHRDYLFHRLNYGNYTHVNISVVLQEDNKAILQVALDRSDKSYYACDGGCHNIVQLGPEKITLPVKLTQPLTPILYITYDRQHMEDLRHAIHVKEIVEAPAHEHHVIALHKHGHHLGGLPTFFWVIVSTLIVIFHLFLFKLIYNEYCTGGSQDRHRFRYGKL